MKIQLREERNGKDARFLWAYLDERGALHIDGQDLGPATKMVSGDGEYEWFQAIKAEHLPKLIQLLGGKPGDDVLDVLANWCGPRSHALEKLLRESGIPIERAVY